MPVTKILEKYMQDNNLKEANVNCWKLGAAGAITWLILVRS